jgi:hypothetical protein
MADILAPLHVLVRFGEAIPASVQGVALLDFERSIRAQSGLRVEVFKEAKGDDSKLRSAMTAQQRAKL